MPDEIIRQSFNTSPDTVFGLFIAVLLLIIVSTAIFLKSLYTDYKETREEERKAEEKKEEQTNSRLRELHESNLALQREAQKMLVEVVQANTSSSQELVNELRMHREVGQKLADGASQAMSNAKLENQQIKDLLKDILQKVTKP